ncbi:phosphatidylinositol 4-kinase [Heterostelium album PN500]|uniref:1-phosphatidylinositol 4-kinase n=1 Tax=Heterostelium pallidum (strain ATCC 26659 / Pp 5 / PN500) TaxID=670386 RepID=D3AXB4_HETP5|nr:phosphatidylinositol 4-kinase [Heterostelium album PN500]EFA86183.1 phosphatidylinositol 4-kinase [Heterostelium album PN500]|eukprot:XP_020438288.1 phosphatidylinositol 4-kinase [Heterostelium album PN500]
MEREGKEDMEDLTVSQHQRLATDIVHRKEWRRSPPGATGDTNLPLWLRPYLVIATGQDSGLIETIPDSTSLDTLKKKCPKYSTLTDYFVRAYGDQKTKSFQDAQTNFIESLAGYSLVCYFLQIKDRHNGNILIDRKGHLIHIDYGFLLSTSPGSINFESAPFKLTDEILELMGGRSSDRFVYFKTLILCGFLQVRKHYQEFLMMIELMIPHTTLRCLTKEGVVDNFRNRFRLDLTSDAQCEEFVDKMISDSIGNWTTKSYDSYQYYTNNITF